MAIKAKLNAKWPVASVLFVLGYLSIGNRMGIMHNLYIHRFRLTPSLIYAAPVPPKNPTHTHTLSHTYIELNRPEGAWRGEGRGKREENEEQRQWDKFN